MNIEDFLSRLEKVRRTGPKSWTARCPAHEDRSPSLSVGIGDNESILIKCFAECAPAEIVGSVGLELSDLFPEKVSDAVPPTRRTFPARDVLSGLADELLIITIIACDMHKKREIPEEDYQRLFIAYERVCAARTMALGE